MIPIDIKYKERTGPWQRLGAALAGAACLASALPGSAQVSVDTIGGGIRVVSNGKCGPTAGFASGNTYSYSQFNGPFSCALDTNGNLWIADKNNSDIEQVSQAGNKAASITTQYYTVTGTSPHFTTNFHAFTNVTAVAVDSANNLYVLLPSPPEVVKFNLTAQSSTLNVVSALFLTNVPSGALPCAMTVDASSNVFLAFTNGNILRFPLIDSNHPPTIYSNNYALGASPQVHYIVTGFGWKPSGMALLANGQLAVSDIFSDAIWTVSTNDYTSNSGPQLITGGNGAGYDDGPPAFAQFNQPYGLGACADGRLIVCDTMNNRLRVIDTSSNTTTLYGTSTNVWGAATNCGVSPVIFPGWMDGVPGNLYTNAAGREPVSVAISPAGSLFVTELYYSLIRQVNNVTFVPVNLNATRAVAMTQPASGITATNASLNGTVYPGDVSTSYFFEWSVNTSYGNNTATNLLTANLTSTQTVSVTLSNLLPGSTYHFQLVAFNALGYSYGGDQILVTPAEPPVVSTQPATGITNTSATLNSYVNPEYSPTTVYFQWGPNSTNLVNTTPLVNLTSNLSQYQTVSATLANLQLNTVYYYQAVAVNSGGTTFGNTLLFNTPYVPPPTVSFSPNSGYYPECVTIYVTSSVPTVYYTTDGTTPTTNSQELVLTNSLGQGTNVGSFQWCNSQQSLSSLEMLAINGSGSNSATVVHGGYTSSNLVGFPQPLSGGPGGYLYIPVVVDLESNVTLQSLQFRVEVTPNQADAPMIDSLSLQPLTANDFVPLPGPAPADGPVSFETFAYTTSSNGQGLVISAPGYNSGLNMTGFGVVVMLHLQIPPSATNGQSYSLNVLQPSGTSDGQQAGVSLGTLAMQTLTISDPLYMVGDSSPSGGYNAGQFGAGALDNSDVNNAIYASVGIRVPPTDSDLYNAMDAWPPDSAGRGGDGFIRLLDWETILARSLGGVPIYPGLDTNNYVRFWTNDDNGYPSYSVVDWYPGGPSVILDPVPPAPQTPSPSPLFVTSTLPGQVWSCQASIGSGVITSAIPGVTYSLPVYAKVAAGYSLSALQFRATVTGSTGAPAVTSLQFNKAAGISAPLTLPGLAANDKVHAWGFGSFSTPLKNSNYLGTISFTVPASATKGTRYALHFSGVDGAPGNTLYQLESFPGYVWVMSSAQQPVSITSDEWKLAFFGSVTNALAADNVDADGDGAPNWQEYLAGTDPINPLSRLAFTSANVVTNGVRGVAINWLTAPGKTYVLQSSPALAGSNWTPINTNSGDGNNYQCVVTNLSGNCHFYQIRLQ